MTSETPGWAERGEGARRWACWAQLLAPEPDQARALRDLAMVRLYGGAGDTWSDKQRTESFEYPEGLTVSMLHHESPDHRVWPDAGLTVPYPVSEYGPEWDAREVRAMQNCQAAGIPLLVIAWANDHMRPVRARWAWVASWDDDRREFALAYA